ncbi:MAG: (deoxy)nucleoside triphosphate pyrophosphohydrolase [Deltaproteobacteria bacterium]|nr:(deoxy)nucleoside triphosphate pyrophosphohydrolase [Deltaproteobacteria bacterium]MDA8308312.1 (deoxy)nucleoside triphosphate pyrophosphohydrolase [Deltaproteobacteria bacterium]
MKESSTGLVVITTALITSKGRLLVAQRPPLKKFGLLWQFPGGKVEPGEGFEESLVREIREELCLDIRVRSLFKTISRREPGFEVDLHAYWCEICGGSLCLREHVALKWVTMSELKGMEFTKADRLLMPFLEKLAEFP